MDNVRSNIVSHRLGARKEGTLGAAFTSKGTYVDQHLSAIVGGLE
jgi:RimJ/RimL family protein N-acetyltransferase